MNTKQLFSNYGDGYAPMSLGCPSITHPVDYQVFNKSKEEKLAIANAKLQHSKFMKKHGVDGNKFLNTPELRLEKSIVFTT